jgi:hypothetical protein
MSTIRPPIVRILLLVLSLATGCATRVLRDRHFEVLTIPFESSPGDTDVLVPVLVNGRHKVRVALDTGAAIEVLGAEIAEKFGLTPTEMHLGHRLNQDPIEIRMGEISSLTFGNITKANWMVAPISYFDETSKQLGIQGLISLKFFEDHPFTIDYKRRVVIIETPESLRDRQKRGHRIPLHLDRQFSRALDAYVDLHIDRSAVQRAIVDTGSAPTKLPMPYFDSLNLSPTDPKLKIKEFKTIAGTNSRARFLPIPGRITLRDAPEIANDESPVRFEERLRAGSIGGRFFGNLAVTFNLPESEMIVSGSE